MLQLMLFDDETKCLAVSQIKIPHVDAMCAVRNVPEGVISFKFEFPYRQYRDVVQTSDRKMFVAYGCEHFKDVLYTFDIEKGGKLIAKYPIKYPDFKDVSIIVALPDKPDQVAFIDPEKANIIDITKVI